MSTIAHPSEPLIQRRRPEQTFFRAKFHAPGAPRHLVRRLRTLALLDALAEYPVTAIVAPAGAGKTALAADWLRHREHPTGWVTLDASDRAADQLWSTLVTAVDLMAPGAITGQGRRMPGDADISTVLAGLLPPVGYAGPMTLVIDDVDKLDGDEGAGAVLAAFVEHRPSWLHLLVLSRRQLPLPVERLRVSGALADIGFDALRLSPHEAAALLTSLCPDLPTAEVMAAVERADGWAAAVQLAALTGRSHGLMSSRHLSTAAGPPDKLVDEYLWKEVLGPARPDLVGLLLATAVVERISYGLAEALTGRPDAGDLLEDAERAGLFVTALDREWFEVHSLVRDGLVNRLQLRRPDTLRTQHARAAEWFESAGETSLALEHWLSSERPTDVLRVLSDLALPLLESDRAGRVLDALEHVPVDAATRDPENAVRYAWCHLAGGRTAFVDTLANVEAAVGTDTEPSRMGTLRAVSHWLEGDWRRAAAQAHGALDAWTRPPGHPADRFGWRLIGFGTALDERWDETASAVGQGRAASLRDPATRGSFEELRALGLGLAGRTLAAGQAVEAAAGTVATGRHESLRAPLALAAAVVERELDHRDAAQAGLEELARRSTYPDPVIQLLAQLELVKLRMSAGDLAGASAGLEDAERTRALLAAPAPAGTPPAAAPAELVARVGVDLALASDDTATAARWAEDIGDPFWSAVCNAKVLLARGRAEEALEALGSATPRGPRHEVVSGLLRARALVAQDRAAALDQVGTTLELAAGQGMLQTVAAEGTPVTELIELASWRVPVDWMDALRRVLVPTWVAHDARRPIEDLTDRERDVLRLLPSRLTLSEIAAELYVSQNTLKFHLRAIYRKLGVFSRGEAVDSARQMLLLPRG